MHGKRQREDLRKSIERLIIQFKDARDGIFEKFVRMDLHFNTCGLRFHIILSFGDE